jgi:hypothetical protein
LGESGEYPLRGPIEDFPEELHFGSPLNLRLWHRIAMPTCGFKLREIADDALIGPLKTSLHLGLSKVPLACIDSREARSINRNARFTEQIKVAA